MKMRSTQHCSNEICSIIKGKLNPPPSPYMLVMLIT